MHFAKLVYSEPLVYFEPAVLAPSFDKSVAWIQHFKVSNRIIVIFGVLIIPLAQRPYLETGKNLCSVKHH